MADGLIGHPLQLRAKALAEVVRPHRRRRQRCLQHGWSLWRGRCCRRRQSGQGERRRRPAVGIGSAVEHFGRSRHDARQREARCIGARRALRAHGEWHGRGQYRRRDGGIGIACRGEGQAGQSSGWPGQGSGRLQRKRLDIRDGIGQRRFLSRPRHRLRVHGRCLGAAPRCRVSLFQRVGEALVACCRRLRGAGRSGQRGNRRRLRRRHQRCHCSASPAASAARRARRAPRSSISRCWRRSSTWRSWAR